MILKWDPKTKRHHEMQGKKKKAGGKKFTTLELVEMAMHTSEFRFDGTTTTVGPR